MNLRKVRGFMDSPDVVIASDESGVLLELLKFHVHPKS